MQLSIVIPVRNEAGNVAALAGEIRTALEGRYDYEVVFVDDASSDATVEELRAAAEEAEGRLRILRHPRGCGQSTAVWNGVVASRAPLIATLDGDGQNDPADIPVLIERLAAAPAKLPLLVIGHRTRRNDNAVRLVSSRIANRVRQWLLKDQTPDAGCGIKAFRREEYLALPYFDHMHRFLPALMQRHGGEVLSVPVNHRARQSGHSKYGIHNRLWTGILDLLGVAWLIRREKRIPGITEERIVHVRPVTISTARRRAHDTRT